MQEQGGGPLLPHPLPHQGADGEGVAYGGEDHQALVKTPHEAHPVTIILRQTYLQADKSWYGSDNHIGDWSDFLWPDVRWRQSCLDGLPQTFLRLLISYMFKLFRFKILTFSVQCSPYRFLAFLAF